MIIIDEINKNTKSIVFLTNIGIRPPPLLHDKGYYKRQSTLKPKNIASFALIMGV